MNIIVDFNYPIKDGTEVVFRSPVDCSQVTGLIVNYNDVSHEFAFADAHGNNVGDIDHLFAENVVVKVILDVTTGMAFVQNADTNAYLEGRFAECLTYTEQTLTDEQKAQARANIGAVDTEEVYEVISPWLDDIQNTAEVANLKAENAISIAKGRATGYVFDTKADMDLWLTKETNTAKLNLGDNLYIRDTGVPDYWWDGENVQQLETQKVDLAEYAKFTDLEQKADAIVCTAQGETISVTDSSNDPIRGLKIFGKTTQDGTPSVDNPVALMSVGDSGNVTVYVTQGEDGVEDVPVATPNGLLGIPVSSGGNYTDASGQQWLCDEIDLGRGVYVQRVRRFELAVADMNNLEEYPGWKNVEGLKECVEHLTGIPNINWPRLINIGGYVNVNTSGTNELLFLTPVSNGGISQSEWKATYPDLIVDVMLPLEEEVKTLLSAEEIAQFKTLHTNYPTTDINNSEDAYMALEYNVDTKTYVDNGIASVPGGGGGGESEWEILQSYELPADAEEITGGLEIGFPDGYNDYMVIATLQAPTTSANTVIYPRTNVILDNGQVSGNGSMAFWDYYNGVVKEWHTLLFEKRNINNTICLRMIGSVNIPPIGKKANLVTTGYMTTDTLERKFDSWRGVKFARNIAPLSNYILLGRK